MYRYDAISVRFEFYHRLCEKQNEGYALRSNDLLSNPASL